MRSIGGTPSGDWGSRLADMNPAITDIRVRAWRTANGWVNLGFGVGALLAGIGCGIVFALMGGNHGGDDLSLLITFEASVPLVLYPCVVICLIVGFSRINREPRDVDHAARPRHVRDYRPLLVALYPPIVLLANLALMAVLVVRLAPGFDPASLVAPSRYPACGVSRWYQWFFWRQCSSGTLWLAGSLPSHRYICPKMRIYASAPIIICAGGSLADCIRSFGWLCSSPRRANSSCWILANSVTAPL